MSAFVKQHLPILLVDHLTNGSSPPRALSDGFLEMDARLGASRIDCEFSGSTCVVAYLKVGRVPLAKGRGLECVKGFGGSITARSCMLVRDGDSLLVRGGGSLPGM